MSLSSVATLNNTVEAEGSSFRDPSGFIFRSAGQVYRAVNELYRDHYETLISSGLYDELCKAGLLISHSEIKSKPVEAPTAFKVILPEQIPFISYPHEWCFSALRDAALLTLAIQRASLKKGMTLKDASAYNVQFLNGKPIFIDTLSFEKIRPGESWVAYRQFCEHFLAPLLLMAKLDVSLGRLLQLNIDGIPLELVVKLLPFRSFLSPRLFFHVYLHAKSKKRYSEKINVKKVGQVSPNALHGLIDSLEGAVRGLKLAPPDTEWRDYYQNTNYSAKALEAKENIIEELVSFASPKCVWDLGSNNGAFSRIAAKHAMVLSIDGDPSAVELNYLNMQRAREGNLLPLIMDLSNLNGGFGFEGRERGSLFERGEADLILALALIHHLAISANLPLSKIARFMRRCGKALIIEFVPKEDSQVKRLLSSRADIFTDYTQPSFEREFNSYFEIVRKVPVIESCRTIYYMIGR